MATSIYADEMTGLMHGSPLWEPDCRPHEVTIGDVGYIRQGRFCRLFNATLPPGDPRNEFGTPAGFEQLVLDERAMIHRRLPPGALVSRSIVNTGADIEFNGSVLQAGAGFRFSCTRDRGAALIINSEGLRRDSEQRGSFKKYMHSHYKAWLPFANNPPNSRDVSLHDLVFVTGRDNTADWAVAAFAERATSGGISFQAGFTPLAGGTFSIWGSWVGLRSMYTNCGPQLQPMSSGPQSLVPAITNEHNRSGLFCAADLQLYDQCIFMRGFKFMDRTSQAYRMIRLKISGSSSGFDLLKQPMFGSKTRSTTSSTGNVDWSSRISGGGGGSKQGGSTSTRTLTLSPMSPQSEGGKQLEMEYTTEPESFSPAEYLLVYILHNSEAELAMIHDDDIAAVVKACKEYTTFIGALSQVLPPVVVDSDKVGMIAIDDKPTEATSEKDNMDSGIELDAEKLQAEINILQTRLTEVKRKISLFSATGPAATRERSLQTEIEALQKTKPKPTEGTPPVQSPPKAKSPEERKDAPVPVPIPERLQRLRTELEILRKERTTAHASRGQLFQERDELQKKVKIIHEKRQVALERQRLEQMEGEERKRREHALRAEGLRKEKHAKEERKRLEARARLLERASAPAFVAERLDYQTLLAYFSPMIYSDGSSTPPAVLSSPSTPGSTRRSSIVVSPSDRENYPGAGWTVLQKKKKTDEDFFVGKSSGSSRKQSTSSSSSLSSLKGSKRKLNIPMPTLALLAKYGLTLPTTVNDVPNTISEIRRKLEWIDDNEKEVTANNLAMVEASLPPLRLSMQ